MANPCSVFRGPSASLRGIVVQCRSQGASGGGGRAPKGPLEDSEGPERAAKGPQEGPLRPVVS